MHLLDIVEPGEDSPTAPPPIAVGIDLGTTHSLVAVIMNDTSYVIPDEEGRYLCPSALCYDADGAAHVGFDAIQMATENPQFPLIRSIKRLMGRGIDDSLSEAYPIDYTADNSRLIHLQAGGRRLTPVEVSAEILKHLKAQAERACDVAIAHAVITVPAYFNDAQRHATKDAARLAGLEVLRIINEPTAAALAYGLDQQNEGTYLVYDLGGGTFDVTVLRMQGGVFHVLATGGDTSCGGDDIDSIIARHCLDTWRAQGHEGLDELLHSTQAPLWHLHIKDAREALSDQVEVTLHYNDLSLTLTRAQLQGMMDPLIATTLRIVDDVLEQADIEPSQVKGVILVGGMTRTPYICTRLAAHMGRVPLLADKDPDHSVAHGAAIQAAALSIGASHTLLDVTALSLGIETMGGIVEKIIPRNSPIPITVTQEFTTYVDGQDGMEIHIVQGEREMVSDCRSLAHFTLRPIPPMKAGQARIAIRFQLDVDGLLTVTAEETTTQCIQEVCVKPSYGMMQEEMESMLMASIVHQAEDKRKRDDVEKKILGNDQ